MPVPVRMRLACDRCHSQKLKCPKRPGSNICARCLKAGASCTYSPPGGVAAAVRGDVAGDMEMGGYDPVLGGNGVGNSFDWLMPQSTSDLDVFLNAVASEESEQTSGVPAQQWGTEKPARPATEAAAEKSACTRRLSDLMVDLDRLWAGLPHQSALHRPRGESAEAYAAKFLNVSPRCMMEQIFLCGQGLIDVYPLATKLATSLAADSSFVCNTSECIHSLAVPEDMSAIDKHASEYDSVNTIDHALANMVISCHLRLLDILERICVQVVTCFKVTLDSPTLREPEFDVVEMQVGTFTAEKGASVLMQFALLKHFLSVLSAKAKYFEEAISLAPAPVSSPESRVVLLQCEILRNRHDVKTAQVRVLEENLIKFGAMKS